MKNTLLMAGTGVCCLAVIAGVTTSSLRTVAAASSNTRRLANVHANIADLQRLQAERPVTLGTKEPGTGLSSQVSDALMRAGLPVSVLSSLTPDPEMSLSTTLRKRTFRLSLQPVRLPDLGRFLSDWRTHHPEWRAISMQCTPQQIDPRQPIDRTSDVPAPISALVVFESVYATGDIPGSRPVSADSAARPIPPNSAPLLR